MASLIDKTQNLYRNCSYSHLQWRLLKAHKIMAIVQARTASAGLATTLDQLPTGAAAVVTGVASHIDEGGTDFTHRLMELGFVSGEPVRVLARGVFSGEPMAVRIGGTTFALRKFEAAQISVKPLAPPGIDG
jgi:ferrous iron transport protein A